MKNILKIVAVAGMLLFTSGCATSQAGLKGGTCDNAKCQCSKPCKCGTNCQCGTK